MLKLPPFRSLRSRLILFGFLGLAMSTAFAQDNEPRQKMAIKPLPIPALAANLEGGFLGESRGVLLLAGSSGNVSSAATDGLDVWMLPAGGSWQSTAWKAPRWAAATSWGTSLVIAGGLVNGHPTTSVTLLGVENGKLNASELPSLPQALAGAGAAVIDNKLYVFGGVSAVEPAVFSAKLWVLDLAQPAAGWQAKPDLPGGARAFAAVTTQYGMLCVIGGLQAGPGGALENTAETWVYRPTPLEATSTFGWKRGADAPAPLSHAVAIALGQAQVMVLGGTHQPPAGLLAGVGDLPGQSRPLLYQTITNAWCEFDQTVDVASPQIVRVGGITTLFGDVTKDGSTSTVASEVMLPRTVRNLSWIDYVVIVGYFIFISSIGVYFSRKQESSEEFSLGNRKVPWWAAGISMFATGASAISFMAIPALAFATNLVWLTPVLLLIPAYFVNAHFIFPLLRRMNITSTYEYLERRFNRTLRLIASAQCMLLQTFGRASIVLVLPSLAISAVTGINVFVSVIVMGVLTTIYTALGGFEAVIWTEVFQGILKLVAPIIMIFICIRALPGGLQEFWNVGVQDHKFDFYLPTWDVTVPAIWILVVSYLLQFTIYRAGDQPIIQRVFSSPLKDVRRVTAMDAVCGILIGTIVNVMGLAIYCYFRAHPAKFDPMAQNDQIVPLFTVQAMPTGVAGMVVAAIFASAMATVASSMNSVATIYTEDFYSKIRPQATDRQRLFTMKTTSYLVGAIATGIALWLATQNIKSILVVWNQVSALLGGGIVGVYSLGMFTRRSTGFGAVCGAILSVIITLMVKLYTPFHWTTYLPIAILSCMLFGYLFSLMGPQRKDLAGLTVYTPKETA